MASKQPSSPPLYPGDWRMPRPNPQWPDEIRYLIRFYVAAKGETLDPCPVCGSRKRGRWTMLCPFIPHTLEPFTTRPHGERPPLTLVCSEHPIAPIRPILDVIYGPAEAPRDPGPGPGGPSEED